MRIIQTSLLSAVALGAASLLATPASAQEIENIGNEGQFVISAERLTGLFFDNPEDVGDIERESVTTVALLGNSPLTPSGAPRVGFDYFVADSISVGGSVYYFNREGNSVFYLQPRVGYAYQIDDTFALWPKGGFSIAVDSPDEGDSDTKIALNLEGAVAISPVEHFAILTGPFVDIPLGGDNKVTSFGLTAGLATYF